MDGNRQPLRSWAIPDVGQPLNEVQREVIDAAFDLLEQLLRGRIVLIVARMDGDGYSFMEPRNTDVDFARVRARLDDIIEFMQPEM